MKKIPLYFIALLSFWVNAEELIGHNYIIAKKDNAFVIPNTIFKSGDIVNFTLNIEKSHYQISYECGTKQLFINYINTFYDEYKRHYPKSTTQYTPPVKVNNKQNNWIGALSEIEKSCLAKSDYRVISARQHNNPKVIVTDINDIQQKDNIILWMYYPNDMILYDIPYHSPYAYKAEKVILSCSNQKQVMIHGYDVYQDFVSDSAVLLMQSSIADKELINNICDIKNRQQLEKYHFPTELPSSSITQEMNLSDELSKLINPYQITAPKYTFSKIVTSGISTYKGKSKIIGEVTTLEATLLPNIFREKLIGDGYQADSISFMGFIKLKGVSEFSNNMIDSSMLESVQISKKIDELVIGDKFNYSFKKQSKHTLFGEMSQTSKYDCQVEGILSGKELHPNIKGNIKTIQCSDKQDQYKRTYSLFYLEDYHYVINLKSTPNEFYYSESQIIEFE